MRHSTRPRVQLRSIAAAGLLAVALPIGGYLTIPPEPVLVDCADAVCAVPGYDGPQRTVNVRWGNRPPAIPYDAGAE